MSDNTPQSVEESKPLAPGGLTWFELPATNIERAVACYSAILGEILVDISAGDPCHMFPSHGGGVTGAVAQRKGPRALPPGDNGAMVYLHVEGKLADVMARVEPAGGTLLSAAMNIPGVVGTFCIVRDSEGNHVGLHARS
jgi:predicted enzyme related to lactoylglutathione lyase